MPTLSTFYGIVIQMFWQDYPPPHFHALYAEYEALIDIRDTGRHGGPPAPPCTFSCLSGRRHIVPN